MFDLVALETVVRLAEAAVLELLELFDVLVVLALKESTVCTVDRISD